MSSKTTNVTLTDGIVAVHPRSMEGRPPGMGRTLPLHPSRTAVLVVDVQRYFVETPPFSAVGPILKPLARFLKIARAAGMTIVHVTTAFQAAMEDAGRPGSRTRQMMDAITGHPDGRGGYTMVEGSWTTEIPTELGLDPSDLVVVKKRFSGFADTTLDALLRGRGIESVIFCGCTTTVCVESTLRDALFLEYDPVVLADCTSDMSPALHESALRRIDLFFGWVCESGALGEALDSVTPVEARVPGAATT